jgi:hypothetical protein
MARPSGARTRTSAAVSADVNTRWRLRCQALEEQLQATIAALRASEAERRELGLDYKHVLDRLWRQSTRAT